MGAAWTTAAKRLVGKCEAAAEAASRWRRSIVAAVGRNFRILIPYIKATFVVCIFAAPWAYAVHGLDTLALLPFGILTAIYYTRLYRWDAGAVFGVLIIYFLGPTMALVVPFVTDLPTFLAASAMSGALWGFIYGLGVALMDQAGLNEADPFSAESETSKSLIGLIFGLVPMKAT